MSTLERLRVGISKLEKEIAQHFATDGRGLAELDTDETIEAFDYLDDLFYRLQNLTDEYYDVLRFGEDA